MARARVCEKDAALKWIQRDPQTRISPALQGVPPQDESARVLKRRPVIRFPKAAGCECRLRVSHVLYAARPVRAGRFGVQRSLSGPNRPLVTGYSLPQSGQP